MLQALEGQTVLEAACYSFAPSDLDFIRDILSSLGIQILTIGVDFNSPESQALERASILVQGSDPAVLLAASLFLGRFPQMGISAGM